MLYERKSKKRNAQRKRSVRRQTPQSQRLQLRVDSRKGRRVRKKQTNQTALKFFGFGLLVIGALLGVWWTSRQVTSENSHFALDRLEIETDGTLTDERLFNLAGLEMGTNLFEVELTEVRQRLLAQPVIREALVERVYPDMLRMKVSEREPIAWLSCPPLGIHPMGSGNAWLVDSEGIALRCEIILREYSDLPVIHATHLDHCTPGEVIDSEGVMTATAIVSQWIAYEAGGQAPLQAVRVVRPWVVRAEFADGLELQFATRNLPTQFENLDALLRMVRANGERLVQANLAVEKHLPYQTVPIASQSRENPGSEGGQRLTPVRGNSENDQIRERQLELILGNG